MKDYRLRHWLFFGGAVMFAASPVAAFVDHRWSVWALMVGVGGVLLSVAVMLVPEKE